MGYTTVATSNSTHPLDAVPITWLVPRLVQLIFGCHRVLVWPWPDREGRLVNGLTPLGNSCHQTLWRLPRLLAVHPSYSTLSCCSCTVTQPEHWLQKPCNISLYCRVPCSVRYVYLVYVSPFGASFIGCGLGPCMTLFSSICTRYEITTQRRS
jgi:hypothetical protein